MSTSRLPLLVSALVSGAVGVGAGALLAKGEHSQASGANEPAARQPTERTESLRPPERRNAPRARAAEPADAGAPAGGAARGKPSHAAAETRAAELLELRERARVANEQLSAAQKRIGKLERELEKETPPGEPRTRHAFDFTPDDWREMAGKDMIKFRLPCGESGPTVAVLDELGMSSDDGEVLREAFQNSRTRQWAALLPLCAAALGGQMGVARSLSFEACQSLAAGSSQTSAADAKHVTTYMAGDAPRPGEASSVTEQMFLQLAEEPERFEAELTETFGPEEAHRLVYSDRLCFNASMHRFAKQPSSDPPGSDQ